MKLNVQKHILRKKPRKKIFLKVCHNFGTRAYNRVKEKIKQKNFKECLK